MGAMKRGRGYVRYIQGIQPNVPAHTKCRHGFYHRNRPRASTILEPLGAIHMVLRSAQLPTSFHQPHNDVTNFWRTNSTKDQNL